jgi:hypothetical protein
MTGTRPAHSVHDDPLGDQWPHVVVRSTSTHPGDWGRAIALALERLGAQVARSDGVAEAHVLTGRAVLLEAIHDEDGVQIVVELAAGWHGSLDNTERDGGSRDDAAEESSPVLRAGAGLHPASSATKAVLAAGDPNR